MCIAQLVERAQGGHLTPDGSVLVGGMMEKMSPAKQMFPWQPRWFELTNETLAYYQVTGPIAVLCGEVCSAHCRCARTSPLLL